MVFTILVTSRSFFFMFYPNFFLQNDALTSMQTTMNLTKKYFKICFQNLVNGIVVGGNQFPMLRHTLQMGVDFWGGRKLECLEKTLVVSLRLTETEPTYNINFVVEERGVIDVLATPAWLFQRVQHMEMIQIFTRADGNPVQQGLISVNGQVIAMQRVIYLVVHSLWEVDLNCAASVNFLEEGVEAVVKLVSGLFSALYSIDPVSVSAIVSCTDLHWVSFVMFLSQTDELQIKCDSHEHLLECEITPECVSLTRDAWDLECLLYFQLFQVPEGSCNYIFTSLQWVWHNVYKTLFSCHLWSLQLGKPSSQDLGFGWSVYRACSTRNRPSSLCL